MDNYYTSPGLSTSWVWCLWYCLNKSAGTTPSNEIEAAEREIISEKVDDKIMPLKWMNKCPVTMLTTVHDNSVMTKPRWTRVVPGGIEDVRKPMEIEQYNEFMGGVDHDDQLLVLRVLPQDTEEVTENTLSPGRGCHYIVYLASPCTRRGLTHKEF